MHDSAYCKPPDDPECVSISVFGDIKKLALLFERCSPLLLVSVFPMDYCVTVSSCNVEEQIKGKVYPVTRLVKTEI